jgi:hypothetical protein
MHPNPFFVGGFIELGSKVQYRAQFFQECIEARNITIHKSVILRLRGIIVLGR